MPKSGRVETSFCNVANIFKVSGNVWSIFGPNEYACEFLGNDNGQKCFQRGRNGTVRRHILAFSLLVELQQHGIHYDSESKPKKRFRRSSGRLQCRIFLTKEVINPSRVAGWLFVPHFGQGIGTE